MEALVAAGVDTVILAVSYRAELLEQEMAQHAINLGMCKNIQSYKKQKVELVFRHKTS